MSYSINLTKVNYNVHIFRFVFLSVWHCLKHYLFLNNNKIRFYFRFIMGEVCEVVVLQPEVGTRGGGDLSKVIKS